MIYRPQKDGLDDSMASAVVVWPATRERLAEILNADVKDVRVWLQSEFPDNRIGWERTYVVVYKGWAMGFTDTEVK
jgi:hypothetical protein